MLVILKMLVTCHWLLDKKIYTCLTDEKKFSIFLTEVVIQHSESSIKNPLLKHLIKF